MDSIIVIDRLAYAFGKEKILEEIHLTVKKGEIFGLLGPSGAGKTTLVRLIVGILETDQGEIFIHNIKVPSFELMKSIGYMAQSDALYGELTAKENLQFFASIYGLKKQEKARAIEYVLRIVDLTDQANKKVDHYSGGMKRRLSLAAALLHRPAILILDEPTVGMDPILRHAVWGELHRLKSDGTTIIVTTHVMDEAEKCDRLALLRNGRVIASDSPRGLKGSQGVATIEEAFLAFGGRKQ